MNSFSSPETLAPRRAAPENKIPAHRAVAVILAGGASTRMGTDKASIRINGVTLLDRAEQEFAAHFETVVISTREEYGKRYASKDGRRRLIFDLIPGRGPLGGIYSVMKELESELYFVAACDMPFLDGRIAAAMVASAGDYDVVVPRMGNGHLHPLHAIYRETCLPHISRQLEARSNKIIDLYMDIKVNYLDQDARLVYSLIPAYLENVNTMKDLDAVLRRNRHCTKLSAHVP